MGARLALVLLLGGALSARGQRTDPGAECDAPSETSACDAVGGAPSVSGEQFDSSESVSYMSLLQSRVQVREQQPARADADMHARAREHGKKEGGFHNRVHEPEESQPPNFVSTAELVGDEKAREAEELFEGTKFLEPACCQACTKCFVQFNVPCCAASLNDLGMHIPSGQPEWAASPQACRHIHPKFRTCSSFSVDGCPEDPGCAR